MTLGIVVITVLVSLAAMANGDIMRKLIFNPYTIQANRQWYRFITSGFIHLDYMHLFINMLVLFSFGTGVESYYDAFFGIKSNYYFILLYMGALMISVTPSYMRHKDNPGYNALGASGAVSAVLFAAILFDPLRKVYLMGVLPIPGIVAGIGYVAYEYYAGKRGGDNINHDAHLWGAGFGVLFTILLKPALAIRFFQLLTDF